MTRHGMLTAFVLGVLVGISMGTAAAGDVNVTIGGPAVVMAPPMITARPQVLVVPGTVVYTAPHVDFNVFLFGGKYWSLHNDVWFVTPRPGAPWTRVAFAAVPHEVRGVPVSYYKIKPKHEKAMKHGKDKGPKNR